MKHIYALAIWLAAGGYALAADQGSGNGAPPKWEASGGEQQPAPAAQGARVAGQTTIQQSDAVLDGPLPNPAVQSDLMQRVNAEVNPLGPGEIRSVLQDQWEANKAFAAPMQSILPRISALTVDLSPGSSPPLVRAAVNYPSTVSFIDSTGAPWKLGAAPLNGNPSGFTTYWLPNSSSMVVYARMPYATGTVTVLLEGMTVPITLSVSSGEADTNVNTWVVDTRLDLRLPRRGPAARMDAAPESRIGLHDSILQGFLDGVPPKDARRLKTTGSVPETTVWQMGDDLYVRSTAEIRDEFEATLSSADGTHLWKLPVTPYLSFSVMGRTAALTVALE